MLGNVTVSRLFCSGLKVGHRFLSPQALRKSEHTICRHLDDYLSKEKLKPENGGSESHLNDEQTKQLIEHISEHTYAHTHRNYSAPQK